MGGRTAFSAGFLRDLAQVWQEHGRDTMVHTAKTQPATFFAVCARLIGPEVKVTIEQSLPGNLSAQDWQVMREIVEAVKLAFRMPAPSHLAKCWSMRATGWPVRNDQ